MPTKKIKNAKKAVKKPVKAPAKKPAPKAKPAAKKAVKKVVKAVKKIPAQKLPAKKAVVKKTIAKKLPAKKAVKKIEPKKVKKVAKKPEIKKAVKKAPKPLKKLVAKKEAPKKSEPKSSKKIAEKAPKKARPSKLEERSREEKTSLAKTILAKTSEKKRQEKRDAASKAAEKKPEGPQRIFLSRRGESEKVVFKVNDYAVYPSHGIGKIIEIEETKILGKDFKCYLMYFEKEKLTIKIPVSSADKIGLRHLISKAQMDEVFAILRSGVKKLKGMWSRRAQEYETKINSGDIMLLAEVLRDLTRDIEDGERSYSERIIYETAINRLASEYSTIYGSDFEEAKQKVILTAKDKLNSEGKVTQKDEFDDFELDGEKDPEAEEDEENEDEEDEDEEDEDDDFDYDDDDDDDKPRKKRKK